MSVDEGMQQVYLTNAYNFTTVIEPRNSNLKGTGKSAKGDTMEETETPKARGETLHFRLHIQANSILVSEAQVLLGSKDLVQRDYHDCRDSVALHLAFALIKSRRHSPRVYKQESYPSSVISSPTTNSSSSCGRKIRTILVASSTLYTPSG